MTVEQQVLKFNEVNISRRFPIIIMFRLDQFDFVTQIIIITG